MMGNMFQECSSTNVFPLLCSPHALFTCMQPKPAPTRLVVILGQQTENRNASETKDMTLTFYQNHNLSQTLTRVVLLPKANHKWVSRLNCLKIK